jgi:hypothetical protein
MGAKQKNPDKRSKAIRALGLVPDNPTAVRLAEAVGDGRKCGRLLRPLTADS